MKIAKAIPLPPWKPPAPAPVGGFELWTAYYHITHHCNLPGIFQHGILPWTNAHEQGHIRKDISDPEVQKWRNRREPVYGRIIHDYAPLYINPRNAMLYRRMKMQPELVILKISTRVLQSHQHVFTDGNAASNNTQFAKTIDIVESSKTALSAHSWTEIPDGKRRRCAEVLIYPVVEPRFIESAICSNQDLANTISCNCPVPIVIETQSFFPIVTWIDCGSGEEILW